MSEALPYVEQPAKRPPGVTARQWRLAVLYPRFETAKEACLKAGYSLVTASRNPGQAIGSIGTLRAAQTILEARRDSARDVKRKAGSRVNKVLDDEHSDPTYALSAWATASKIAAEYPDEEQGIGDAERQHVRAYIERIVERVLVATGQDVATMSISQLVDNALLTEPASDNM